MDFLDSIPLWVYFVLLGITFMATHVFGYRPGGNPRGNLLLRIVSSVMLLVALLLVDPSRPTALLAALPIAAAAGYVSGRSAPALKPRAPAQTQEPEGGEPENPG